MKLLLLFGPLLALGGIALGTRVPSDTTTIRHVYITRPDPRVAPLTLRVDDLERELREVAARPPGMSGQDVRRAFDVWAGPQVPEEPEVTTTTGQARE